VSVVILRGDAAHLPLPDASVDLICTSPPYWAMRSYADDGEHYDGQIGSEETPAGFIAALVACTREWTRVLKPEGSIFVDLNDKYAGGGQGGNVGGNLTGGEYLNRTTPLARKVPAGFRTKSLLLLPERYRIACVDSLGLIARAKIVWSKPSAVPEGARDRVQTVHEDVVHLGKHPRYFAAVDEIRVPHTGNAHSSGSNAASRRWATSNGGRNHRALDTDPGEYNPSGKLPGSVWEIASVPLVIPPAVAHARCCGGLPEPGCENGLAHHAAYPPELARRIVLGWSPPGAVVLDPFGGTGTTAAVADAHGRTGVTIDRSADYCRIAQWRTASPAERARALGIPKPPPVPEGQGSLFDAREVP